MAKEADLLYGKIALRLGWIRKEQLQRAIQIQEQQEEAGEYKPLGEIFLALGHLDQQRHKRIVQRQKYTQMRKEDKRYGQLAVRNEFTSKEVVDETLAQQKMECQQGTVRRIGEMLLAKGHINKQQHQALLRLQSRLRATPAHAEAKSTTANASSKLQRKAKSSGQPSRWTCSECFASNDASLQVCQVCEAIPPSKEREARPPGSRVEIGERWWCLGCGKPNDAVIRCKTCGKYRHKIQLWTLIPLVLGFLIWMLFGVALAWNHKQRFKLVGPSEKSIEKVMNMAFSVEGLLAFSLTAGLLGIPFFRAWKKSGRPEFLRWIILAGVWLGGLLLATFFK